MNCLINKIKAFKARWNIDWLNNDVLKERK